MTKREKKMWTPAYQVAQARSASVLEVLLRLGGTERPKKGSMNEARKYYDFHGTPVTVNCNDNTYCHTIATSPAGRGAVSFLCHYMGMTLGEACDFILGSSAAAASSRTLLIESTDSAIPFPSSDQPSDDLEIARTVSDVPTPYARGWPRVKSYLAGRGLAPAFLEVLHAEGYLYADGRRGPKIVNAVFRCSETSAFVRGTWDPPPPKSAYKETIGRRSDLVPFVWGCDKATETHIVESPISGLSLVTMNRATRIIALGGAGIRPDSPSVQAAVRGQVVAATDGDHGGDAIAQKIISAYPDVIRIRPREGEDWNDELRRSISR